MLRDDLSAAKGYLAGQLRIDRTELDGGLRSAPWRWPIAAIIIAAPFALGWLDSTIAAVRILFGSPYVAPAFDNDSIPDQLLRLIPSIGVIVLAAVGIKTTRNGTRSSASWTTQLRTFPLYYLATALGFGACGLLSLATGLPIQSYPEGTADGVIPQTLRIIDSTLAGPTEELALMALVVVVIRQFGGSWAAVLLVAIVLRVPFHLYYGWPAVGLALWAVLIVLLYRRTGALTAIVLGHATWNASRYLPIELNLLWSITLPITGLMMLAVMLIRGTRQPATHTTTAP